MRNIAILFIVFVCHFAFASDLKIGVLHRFDREQFKEKIHDRFNDFSSCKSCVVTDITPFDGAGKFDPAQMVKAVESAEGYQVIFVNWNDKYSDSYAPLVKALNAQVAKGTIVVAAAGVPLEKEASCPLNKTLMGNVTQGIIIGELTERDRLLPLCYYGPEMLTAVRAPKELLGQGFAPLYFMAKFADSFDRRKQKDWYSYLMARKAKSKRIWPEMDEFFPR